MPRALQREVTAHRPDERHWYLAYLAVEGRHRGRGLGRRLLEAARRRAAADHSGLFAATSNDTSLRLLDRAGFTQVGRVVVLDGPPTWLLWRNPDT